MRLSVSPAVLGIVLACGVSKVVVGVEARRADVNINSNNKSNDATSDNYNSNLPKYAGRRLHKSSKKSKGKGGNNNRTNRNNNRGGGGGNKVKQDQDDIPAVITRADVDDATSHSSSASAKQGVVITIKNGGQTFSYEFTTPGDAGINNMADADGNVVDGTSGSVVVFVEEEEDVVDISATTPAPTTAAPTAGPTASPVTAPPSKAPSTDEPTSKPSDTPTTASPTASPTSKPTTQAPTTSPTVTPPCGMSSQDRKAALTLQAMEASGISYFNIDSPQKAALDWLIDDDAYMACPGDPKTLQRYTLAVFYYSTDGDNWIDCSAPQGFALETCDNVVINTIVGENFAKVSGTNAWLTPVDECNWAGIECVEDTMMVDRIEFENNGLGGTLPSELQHLSEIRFLYAERGYLEGTIPDVLGSLSNLLVVDLDYNRLTGPIPESIYGLSNLIQLDLNNNELTGTISSSIGLLTNLKFLQVGKNFISGTIPNQLGALMLTIGGFEFTEITGTMPSSVCNNLTGQLVADCAGEPPQIECDCCTVCLGDEIPYTWEPTSEPTAEPTQP